MGRQQAVDVRVNEPGGPDRAWSTMNDPLFADLELARRVEAAWDFLGVANARELSKLAPESRADALAVGGGHAVFLGTGSPLSQAQGLGLDGQVSPHDLERLEQFFHDRHTQPRIEVCSMADPSLLVELSLRGYLIAEQTHSLVRQVRGRSLPRTWGAQAEESAGVSIVQVQREGLERWVDVVLDCFFQPPATIPPLLREGAIAMGRVPGNTAWLALVDGQPAGGGSLMIHDGLALISGDGTLPGFRLRGVQTALLRARLAHALVAGCDLATICTQPGSGSQRNAERTGFQVVYARTTMVQNTPGDR
ncbi:MAG: GNAT family N-acetyltransferase [Isosphaeraceae bacterium]